MSDYDSKSLVDLLQILGKQGYAHRTITPHSHAAVNARQENALAKDCAGALGWSRQFTSKILGNKLFDLLQKANVLQKTENGWLSKVRVSSYRQWHFLHSAFPTHEADSVFFGPDTYRFVQAVERFLAQNHIAQSVLNTKSEPNFSGNHPHSGNSSAPIKRAVDICSGSGIAAIVMGLALPESEIVGVDINGRALELSRINAVAAKANNVKFVHSDLLKNVEGQFDLIVANPPYLLDALQREYRHGGGEFGEQLSLDIVDAALGRLTPNGTLLLYTGSAIVDGQDVFKQKLAAKLNVLNQPFEYEELDPDIFGEELLNPAYASCDRIAAVLVTLRFSGNQLVE